MHSPKPIQVAVVTVSDRAFRGEYQDRSGPLAASLWQEHGTKVISIRVVPDELSDITEAIEAALVAGAQIVMTTGGTGISPRDVTVEATLALLDYQVPGLAQALRGISAQATPTAVLSRAVAGIASVGGNRGMIINAPGSTAGVTDYVSFLAPLAQHIVDQLGGADHSSASENAPSGV